ncbi:hypothetical protein PSI19_15160 [Xenorhabdus khoisanae]|uniref:hypothetical protein n=1 Tax=Xenorhabdus khoisanae TaxID=880157 RepID=UPI002359441B|nr:hypothetical protein [Xenorhabdus khoisanae]MDC9615180.1 hypothetical protein [Xenorhabdus khoisanae]
MFQLDINVSKKMLDLYLSREGVKGRIKTRKMTVLMLICWPVTVHLKSLSCGKRLKMCPEFLEHYSEGWSTSDGQVKSCVLDSGIVKDYSNVYHFLLFISALTMGIPLIT